MARIRNDFEFAMLKLCGKAPLALDGRVILVGRHDEDGHGQGLEVRIDIPVENGVQRGQVGALVHARHLRGEALDERVLGRIRKQFLADDLAHAFQAERGDHHAAQPVGKQQGSRLAALERLRIDQAQAGHPSRRAVGHFQTHHAAQGKADDVRTRHVELVHQVEEVVGEVADLPVAIGRGTGAMAAQVGHDQAKGAAEGVDLRTPVFGAGTEAVQQENGL
ncbi:hypothetical protein D3C72_1446570 [compost metagenome]